MPSRTATVSSNGRGLAAQPPSSRLLPVPACTTAEDLKHLVHAYSQFNEFAFDVETHAGRPVRSEDKSAGLCPSRLAQIRTRDGMEYLTWSHRCQQLPGHTGDHTHTSGKRHWSDQKVQDILDKAKRLGLPFFENNLASTKDKPALDTRTNEVWCVSLAGPGRTDVIPCGHPARRQQLQPAEVFDALAPLFFSDRRKIGHNVAFDLLSAAKYWGGIPPPPYGDTMTMVFLINENLGRYNLGALSSEYLGYDYVEKLGEEAWRVEWKRATRYSMLDAQNAWLLWRKFFPRLQDKARYRLARLFDLEMDVLGVLMDMRQTGAYVDLEGFKRLRPILEEQLRILKDEINEMVGHPINLNSTQQLAKWLYHEIGLHCSVFTDSGQESTSAEALQRLRHKAPRAVLSYKEVSKLLSVYVTGFLPHIDDDNRIRASLNQAVAKTGRLSCSAPNLQNIPARYRENTEGTMIRRLFVAPPGKVLIVADYSQIELRILAHQTKDRRLLYAYKEGIDLHVQTASLIWKIPPNKVPPEKRSIAKNCNFNFAFEGGATRVVAMSGIPLREAEHVYDAWHQAYPGVKKWGTYIKRQCWDHGYVETLYGRKRRLKDITSGDSKKRSYAERQAVNHPVQGTAADIAKLALVRVHEVLRDYDARLVLQIHDEFVIECTKAQVDEVIPLVKVAMEDIRRGDHPVLDVPLEVNIGIGMNWSEAK